MPTKSKTTETAAPADELLISDADTLRALADPLRISMLETMLSRHEDAWSVKELAAALDVPPTRLYHHVELLVERDLIRPASQRLVSGIVETRYRVAAMTFRLDPKLVASESGADSAGALLGNAIDSARAEVLAALRSLPPNAQEVPDRPLVTRAIGKLTPERAAELRMRLLDLLEEFDDKERKGARSYGVLVALYPMPTDTHVPADTKVPDDTKQQGTAKS